MNNINRLKAEQRDKHPGFDSYLECMTRKIENSILTNAFSKIHSFIY